MRSGESADFCAFSFVAGGQLGVLLLPLGGDVSLNSSCAMLYLQMLFFDSGGKWAMSR